MPKDLRSTAGEACASIVSHYSDPIHFASSRAAAAADDTQSANNDIRDGSAPYFDPTLGRPMPDLAPVCGYWHERLVEVATASEGDDDASLHSARALMCCYESTIQPCMKRRRGPSAGIDLNGEDGASGEGIPFHAMIEILRNYELLLAHLMRDASASYCASDVDVAKGGQGNSIEATDGLLETGATSSGQSDEEHLEMDICKMVRIVADDIFQWSTRLPKEGSVELWKVQNALLPCLLRLIEHSVVLIASFQPSNAKSTRNKQIREALAVATLAAVPFGGDGKLKSGVFGVGSLLEWVDGRGDSYDGAQARPSPLSLAHTLQSCSPSPLSKCEESNSSTIPASILSSNFMTRPVIDWSSKSAHFEAPWTDGVSGIGSRAALSLLQRIEQFEYSPVPQSLEEEADERPIDGDTPPSLRRLLHSISQHSGVDLLASMIRAHFYGRLSLTSDPGAIAKPTASGPFMPLIQRIGSNAKRSEATAPSDEKPHIAIPMRTSAAAIMLAAAWDQTCNNLELLDKTTSDALPIALTLLDDVQSINQAIGALIVVAVIEAASLEADTTPTFVDQFGSLVTSSLESAILMCSRGEPTVLATICLAQSSWIRYIGSISRNQRKAGLYPEAPTLARKAASDIFNAIGKQALTGGRDGNDERMAGALVAGVNPLLAQLADLPEAASIEVARTGLSVLLPLIGWSGMSLETRSVHIAATVGLISLMNGAYPIMAHHGKKIMTELVLLLDRADKDAAFLSNQTVGEIIGQGNDNDVVSTDVAAKLALYAAAVAHVICGNGAETVLAHIEATQSRKPLLKRCSEIRAAAEKLRH